MERILIIKLGAIGDVARVLPMLAGLRRRFPDAEIDWVVQSKAADLLRGHPGITRLWVVPFHSWRQALTREAWTLSRGMRKRGYDLVLDFQGMIKGAVWALVASGPGVRVGWGPGTPDRLGCGPRDPEAASPAGQPPVLTGCWSDLVGMPDLPWVARRDAEAAPLTAFSPRLVGAATLYRAYPGSSRSGSHKRWGLTPILAVKDRDRTGTASSWSPAGGEARTRRRLPAPC